MFQFNRKTISTPKTTKDKQANIPRIPSPIRIQDNKLYLFLFLFLIVIFFFILFYFLDLELGFSMILHMTVTNYHKSLSHDHASQKTL